MAKLSVLTGLARQVGNRLLEKKERLVLAESCTGGLVSNVLTRIPGASEWHCGSAVVYRVETKARWLGIDRGVLEKPGPVSREVAALMAETVLEKTPEADWAASVTGHLGPNAPARQDGLIFVAVARRVPDAAPKTRIHRHVLEAGSKSLSGRRLRNRRQLAAVGLVLEAILEQLEK